MELLNQHVTVRDFNEEPIGQNLLESIIYSGTRASTTGNMQLYSIVVSTGGEKDALLPLHFNQPVAKKAPVLLTFVADFNRFNKWCIQNNAKPGYGNLVSFTNALIDAILVAQNVCVAAENHGLGICYLGTTTYNAKEIIDVLGLPKMTFPITTVALGYPKEMPHLNDRIPLNGVVHYGKYGDYSKADIDELYRFKENLLSSKTFVLENQKETLAQVFTDIRYKQSDNEYFSKKMLETMREQGFDV